MMAEMIMRFHDEGISPVVIEGPADEMFVRDLLGDSPSPVPVLRAIDLSALAGVLSHASLFVGHDSGVTHLAALLGVRTVAIFGPTDSARWAPLGSHVTVMEGSPVSVSFMASLIPKATNA
jgi:ADP-heptose:LPS heptosyltransferase